VANLKQQQSAKAKKQQSSAQLAVVVPQAPSATIVPLYHRIDLLLLQNIIDQTFPPDQPMPPEADLCRRMGVSRITLRNALGRLEQEGLVHRQRGRGTFPSAKPPATLPTLLANLRNLASLALRTKVQVLEHTIVPANPGIASAFGLQSRDKVLRIVRVRSDAASPISYSVCHVPQDLAALLPRRRIGSLPISTLLAAAGLILDETSERLSASIAGMEIARHLGVEVGSALLSMTRTVRAESGRMIEHLRVVYRPDRYEYSLEYRGGEANDPSSPWRAKMTDRAS
jgi:GntR family transcriptional regulator